MNTLSFKKELQKIAPDLALCWNGKIDRWQIYQVSLKNSGLITDPAGTRKFNAHLVFTVQEQNGDYRPLDNRTLDNAYKAVKMGRELWGDTKKVNQWVDKIEDDEKEERKKAQERNRIRFEYVQKELKKYGGALKRN